MLQSLHIKNIALIDECKLELGKGLNILSGETGAGKSIIIDSLSFVLGSKADKSLIRYGESKASVEAVFTCDNPIIGEVMEELGIEPDTTVIITRTMTESRNDIRVNGQAVTLAMLKKLTCYMVDILGQHEHHSLMQTATHLTLLDNFGGENIRVLSSAVSDIYSRYKDVKKRLASFGDDGERARRIDALEYQIKEIEKARLVDGEEEELLKNRERFRNGEKILTGVKNSYNALDGEDISVLSLLNDAISELNSVKNFDSALSELHDRAESAKIELKDIADTLYSYGEGFDYDEHTAEKIERRVDTIKTLKRKYGATIKEVLERLELAKKEYDELSGADEEISKLKNKLERLVIDLYNASVRLSKARRTVAKTFETGILAELSALAMKNTSFEVGFSPIPEIVDFESTVSALGIDDVCFNISPNKGEPLRPLWKIASGGEMSRFMLALKNITSGLDGIDTMVFDEIDTGISGNVAFVVAQKMYNISSDRQVIAVTHLPQLASYADRQYLISKSVVGDKTLTRVTLLDLTARKNELVRLTGGFEGSEIGIKHAEELLASAAEYKAKTK